MKKIYISFAFLAFANFSSSQTARVQVIHNSPDASAQTVDLYLDNALLLDDFEFRQASAFMDAPSGVQVTIGVAPGNSSSVDDTIASFQFELNSANTYIVVANGIVSTNGYNPPQPFTLDVFDMGRELASQTGNTDVLVLHGSTDVPMVDIVELTEGMLVDDISYREFSSDYLELPTANYVLNVTPAGGGDPVAAFVAPLQSLNLGGKAIVVVASGFLNPANNSNGPAFGLWAATADGGPMAELPAAVSSVEKLFGNSVKVWPNPATDQLKFTIGHEAQGASVKLINISGQVVSSIDENHLAKNVEQSFDLSVLPAGAYVLSIRTQNGIINKKVAKF